RAEGCDLRYTSELDSRLVQGILRPLTLRDVASCAINPLAVRRGLPRKPMVGTVCRAKAILKAQNLVTGHQPFKLRAPAVEIVGVEKPLVRFAQQVGF